MRTERRCEGQKYDERCELLAKHILKSGATVRSTASFFALSKSTVHKDVTVRLKTVNPPLYAAVREVLEKNKSERHLRGGDATRLMYMNKKVNDAHNQKR